MSILIRLLVNGLAVMVTAYLISGVQISSFFTAVIVSIVLAIVNTFVKPILLVLTLPFNILTLGLFTLIVNGLLIELVSWLVPGFYVKNLGWAIVFSIVLWAVNYVLHTLSK